MRLRRQHVFIPSVAVQPTTLLATVVLACPLLGGCSTTARQPKAEDPDTLTLRRLDIVNNAGALVASLGVDTTGSAGLFLFDGDGRKRAALIHDDDQTAFYLLDGDGTIRVSVAQFAHGGGGVALHGEESNGAAALYLNDGTGSLAFYGPDGELQSQVP